MAPIVFLLIRGAGMLVQKEMKKNAVAKAEMERAETERQRTIDRRRPACAKCETPKETSAAFCHACGGKDFTTKGDISDRKAAAARHLQAEVQAKQEAESARKLQEKARRVRLAEARKHCKEVRRWRYCKPCHESFLETHRFCTGCGTATTPLPNDFILEYMQGDFPDLVRTEADLGQLL